MSERPKFANLQYDVLQSLDISINEYFYLDMIYYLSRDRWCYKSLDSIAHDMKLTKMGVTKLRNRLIDKGLIIKDAKGRVRTSVTYNKVYLQDTDRPTKFTNRYTKFTSDGKLSLPKNNNENNKEYSKTFKTGKGYEKAQRIRDSLTKQLSL